jgi:hypothetical protein
MSQHSSPRRLVLGSAILGILGVLASPAMADIVVISGVNSVGTESVLLNPATDVLTVTGTVGSNNLLVNFTSTSGSQLLNANPAGQETVSGGTGNTPFTNLEFGLANNQTFTQAVFNIDAAASGAVLIHVEGIGITGGFFEDDFTVDANGQNFFTVVAINGQLIESIGLTAINAASFTDVNQVRLGGGEIGAAAVPEASSMFLLVSASIGVAALRRRFQR